MREQLSQSELAEKLGVSTSRISMYEAGKREPDFETEEKIADFFNTDLNTLRGKDNEYQESPIVRAFSGGGLSSKLLESLANDKIRPDALLMAFNELNDAGKEEAIKRVQELAEISHYKKHLKSPFSVAGAGRNRLNAANERTDIKATENMKKHDNDIMDDENFDK